MVPWGRAIGVTGGLEQSIMAHACKHGKVKTLPSYADLKINTREFYIPRY